jgi:proteasome lid subunit RPN8/RPN11
MTLHISQALLREIWEHGSRHYPEEGAGLLLGIAQDVDRTVVKLLPVQNNFCAESRHNRYLITPQDILAAEQHAEEIGLDVIGVYHSHPDHPARPSEYDRQMALPWYSYLITSVHDGQAQESRSWRIPEDRGQMIEETMQIKEIITMEEVR